MADQRDRVVGIDWAAQPANRAAVVLDLADRRVGEVARGIDDEAAGALCRRDDARAVGVDVPFGWPRAFAAFVAGWACDGRPHDPPADYPRFAFRETDHVVHQLSGKKPLSVATDRIALAARAWLAVVQAHNLGDRIDVLGRAPGAAPAPLVEVYPAGVLAMARRRGAALPLAGYRRDRAQRRRLLDALADLFELAMNGSQRRALLGATDTAADELDALLAAINAAAYARSLPGWDVVRPDANRREAALAEGWIFLPTPAPRS